MATDLHRGADCAAIPAPISRTALDALHAKLSAVEGGWLGGGGGVGESEQLGDGCEGKTNPSGVHRGAIDDYCRLLRRICDGIDGGGKARRQTPLVNAGYAARVAVVTFVLERWIKTIATHVKPNGAINVVVLGCGMDVLGIWTKHLLQQKAKDAAHRVKVYEFDAWDNCMLKRRALLNAGLLKESISHETDGSVSTNAEGPFRAILRGCIALDAEHPGNQSEDDYFLSALDLRCTTDDGHQSILTEAMQNLGLDFSRPTIVLSELVLAYLGLDGANATLRSIADVFLGSNEHSMFVCFEPVFPCECEANEPSGEQRNNTSGIMSVEESYARDYGRQFLEKLQRGNSKQAGSGDTVGDSLTWFHPLGSNLRTVERRLEQCGFALFDLVCTSLGVAAANVTGVRRSSGMPCFLRAKEPFDEHAALALKLNCYGVVCVFAGRSVPETNMEWMDNICPWSSENKGARLVHIHHISSSKEDMQVRDIYGKIYAHLYEEYPAIRKVVKSALEFDLCSNDSKDGNSSAIRNRFQEKGGEFWVAADPTDDSKVAGCIGVKLRKKRETAGESEETASSTIVEYEIQRLAVDDDCRGKGVGRRLLRVAEKFALRREATRKAEGTSVQVKLWTVTPQCLVAANKLYESAGYAKEGTFQAGTLVMIRSCKSYHI
ncbi:hypothetical protein ACHAXT_009454 [Thalassiosira profunda]